jgi:diguanylate cyclase (GGDEF)-like protein/PAS domain S-box-containing protein
MDTPLRVLVVADSPADAEPMLEELRRAGRELCWEIVRSASEMERALAEERWDLVLSDSEISGFGALTARAVASAAGVEAPFLVVSDGATGKSEMLSADAGHLERTALPRLAVDVERQLAVAQLRRERRIARQALQKSEARFRALAESASEAILSADGEGLVVFANRAAERIFGHPIPAMVGRSIERLLPGLLPATAVDPPDGERPTGGPPRAGTGIHADGREIPLELSIATATDNGRRLVTIFARDLSDRRDPENARKDSDVGKSAVLEAALDGMDKDVTAQRNAETALKESEQKLRTLLANMPVVLFVLDREGIFMHSEGEGLRAVGLKPGEVVGRSVWDVYRNYPDILDHLRRALSGDAHTATVRISGAAFETRYAPYRDADGQVIGVIGIATDVTEQCRAEQALRASEARYRMLFERNLAGVFRSTLDGWLLDCNESFARIFGYDSPAEALQQPALDFYLRPSDRKAFLTRLTERPSLTNFEAGARRRDGTPLWILENATLVEGPDGVGPLIEGTVIDITERKRAEEHVKHLAFHDPLTGLPNRLLFNDRLTIALAQAHRSRQKLATLYLDLDRFKVINDSLGHSVGDELLRRVADRLRMCVREEDTVARLGGDEFIILMPRISSRRDAETVARKILTAIRLPFAIEDRDFFLQTSIGVSLYPSDGIDAETLVQNADTAMYRAKEQGRDNYQLYEPAMNTGAIDRLSLENRLRQALQNEELVLHYQPIVDLQTGRVRGAEALLRWRHPERGLLTPGEFITLAEISGLISPIGRWVLQTACEQIREWQAMGHPRLTVSVNLSPRQFQQGDLVSHVTTALAASGVEAGCLDLEITESNAMENAELTIKTLWELRRLGVGISMDDFGTGYSSLNYLKRFPIVRVKLDQSFVRDVVTNSEDAAIVRAVIAMAHTLKLVVAAEGVENEDQLAFLRQHRCDEMQGFLFSPPVEPGEFQKLLQRRQALPVIA